MKKIKLKLVGINGNAFFILGSFKKQAEKEGWSADEIKEVLEEARKRDYYHLLDVISSYCENRGI